MRRTSCSTRPSHSRNLVPELSSKHTSKSPERKEGSPATVPKKTVHAGHVLGNLRQIEENRSTEVSPRNDKAVEVSKTNAKFTISQQGVSDRSQAVTAKKYAAIKSTVELIEEHDNSASDGTSRLTKTLSMAPATSS